MWITLSKSWEGSDMIAPMFTRALCVRRSRNQGAVRYTGEISLRVSLRLCVIVLINK